MRLLFVNQYYPPDAAPTGRYLHDLARTLVARGHDVTVICSRASYAGPSGPAREERDGVQVRRVAGLGLGRRGLGARAWEYAAFVGGMLWRGLSEPRPDLVVALTTPPFIGVPARALARLRGAAHAHWVMDVYPDALRAHGLVRDGSLAANALVGAARWALSGARLLVALGPWTAARVAAYAGGATVQSMPLWSDTALAPWPVDTPNAFRRARGWGDDDLVFMYSGNMGLGHRFGEFLAAARRLGGSGPHWAFVGGGARRPEVEVAARAAPNARVSFHSYVAAADLRESLCAADVHLVSLSSAWQGVIVPSKLQAIFAVGRPALFVGPRDNEVASWIEESGGGWRVDEGDVEGVLAAVAAARDPAERARRGAAAHRYALAHFGRDAACERLARLLEDGTAPPA